MENPTPLSYFKKYFFKESVPSQSKGGCMNDAAFTAIAEERTREVTWEDCLTSNEDFDRQPDTTRGGRACGIQSG